MDWKFVKGSSRGGPLTNKLNMRWSKIQRRVVQMSIAVVATIVLTFTFNYISSPALDDIPWDNNDIIWQDKEQSVQNYQPNEKAFNISPTLLQTMPFPISNYCHLNRIQSLEDIVFVTASNWEYFGVALDAIGSVRKNFPLRKIIFYYLGRWKNFIVKRKVTAFANIEYRMFKFDMYPAHVMTLRTYAFKPLAIHEVLHDHSGVFWFDSSIQFLSGNLSEVFSFVRRTDGVMLFHATGHPTFPVTHPSMYKFLPTRITKMQEVEQFGAGSLVLYKTQSIYTHVIKWWVLCALNKNCISPTFISACQFQGHKASAGCHRFDQSAINILLANAFHFDEKRYARTLEYLNEVERYFGVYRFFYNILSMFK